MCRNHSHIASVITGTVLAGRNTMVEVRVDTPLVVELGCGERWIRPSGVHLLMPYSMRAVLPHSAPALMAVCYIPSSYWEENGMIMTPETEMRLRRAGVIGETASSTMATYQTTEGVDDDVPF